MNVDEKVLDATEELIDAIKDSDAYKRFEEKRKEALRNPELLENIKRTRVIRDQLKSMGEYERNGDYAERLEDEYDNLCDITGVHEYSLAELEFCGLYREIISMVVSNFEIDLP